MTVPRTRHEHLHLFADGLRRFMHVHERPANDRDLLATRVHAHENGRHSHPHDHTDYRALPPGVTRRPIIAADF